MKLSTDRILTTHVGSLPRPADLYDLLVAEDRGETGDSRLLEATAATAVKEIVARQRPAGRWSRLHPAGFAHQLVVHRTVSPEQLGRSVRVGSVRCRTPGVV